MFLLHGEVEERGHAIRQRNGIVLVTKGGCCFLNPGSLNQSRKICNQSLDGSVERLNFGALVRRAIESPRLNEKKRLCLFDLDQRDALESLNERMDRALI